MKTKTQEQEAWAIAVELHRLGIKPAADGNWSVLRPPPPVDLLMRIMGLPPALLDAALLRASKNVTGDKQPMKTDSIPSCTEQIGRTEWIEGRSAAGVVPVEAPSFADAVVAANELADEAYGNGNSREFVEPRLALIRAALGVALDRGGEQ
jgi:hypothetical protein